jgi:hypothetical protein
MNSENTLEDIRKILKFLLYIHANVFDTKNLLFFEYQISVNVWSKRDYRVQVVQPSCILKHV